MSSASSNIFVPRQVYFRTSPLFHDCLTQISHRRVSRPTLVNAFEYISKHRDRLLSTLRRVVLNAIRPSPLGSESIKTHLDKRVQVASDSVGLSDAQVSAPDSRNPDSDSRCES